MTNYAFEGNVHVGKTTYIKNIRKKFPLSVLAPETVFKKELSFYERQVYYIQQEIAKTKLLNTAEHVLMDRSIISCYIYILLSTRCTTEVKKKLLQRIRTYLIQGNIFLPDVICFCLLPYDDIIQYHSRLGKQKGTEALLIDYQYYMKYTLYFTKLMKQANTHYIVHTNLPRQIIEMRNIKINITKMFFAPKTEAMNAPSIIVVDGPSAVGKSTVCAFCKTLEVIPEHKYVQYSANSYQPQIANFAANIKDLFKENILIDSGFLMRITHFFYSGVYPVSQTIKTKFIDELIATIPLNLYVSKLIYLYADMKTLKERKRNDALQRRPHFTANISFVEQELTFYQEVAKALHVKNNIYLIDTKNYTSHTLWQQIQALPEQPLLLIDLFAVIKNLLKKRAI